VSTEDKLRALCSQALQAKTPASLDASLRALRLALNEHFLDAENLAVHLLLKRGRELPLVIEKDEDDKNNKKD
jgi:hypothetical protein